MKTILATTLLVLLAACDDSSSSTAPTVPSIPLSASEPPPPACPTPAGPTLHHTGAIASDETWTAETGPHVIDGDLRVLEGHILTIAPCATVQIEGNDARIEVATPGAAQNGTLLAEGTAERPITISGGQLIVRAPGIVRLAHVKMTNTPIAGSNGPVLGVDHVTMQGAGITLQQAAFLPGSDALTIEGAPGAPLEIGEQNVDSIPRGTYSGNADDAIALKYEAPITANATMKALGVPYLAKELRVGSGDPKDARATLTIEAGTEVTFEKDGVFAIEHVTGDFPATGALVAAGTAAAPVVFRSAAKTPAAGDWRGLWFGGIPAAENALDHVRIEHTGASCGCVLTGCSNVQSYDGAIIFSHAPPRVFVQNTVIAHGSGHGIVLGYLGDDVDFTPTNTFEDLNGCASTLPAAAVCPQPRPACR